MSVEEKVDVKEKLAELLENGNKPQLRGFLNDQYPQDIAESLKDLEDNQILNCFLLLDLEHAGDVLAELSHENQKQLLKSIPLLTKIFKCLSITLKNLAKKF